jgi:hypothetical protein
MTLMLALSQAPKHVEGGGAEEDCDPEVLQPMCWLLAKPTSMWRGRVCDMREEKVGLGTQQMTA